MIQTTTARIDIGWQAKRNYHYANGFVLGIESPKTFHKQESGELIETANGDGVRIEPGFVAVSWTPKPGFTALGWPIVTASPIPIRPAVYEPISDPFLDDEE